MIRACDTADGKRVDGVEWFGDVNSNKCREKPQGWRKRQGLCTAQELATKKCTFVCGMPVYIVGVDELLRLNFECPTVPGSSSVSGQTR
jgi:hypothetical protein